MDTTAQHDPNYCDRNASATTLVVLGPITLIIACVLVLLRMFVRIKLVKAFWWDDICLILALAFMLPTFSIIFTAVKLGLGRHSGCLPLTTAVDIAKYLYVGEVFEILSVICARTSAALFVIRLFGITPGLTKFMYGYIVFMTTSLTVTAILVFLQCRPATALWDPMVPAKCWSASGRNGLNFVNGVVSIMSDFILALLPAYFLRKLQMRTNIKIAVGVLMGLGLIPGICATLRTAFSSRQTSKDAIYDLSMLVLFAGLETSTATICAAIPAIPPLFSKERRTQYSKPHYHYDNRVGKYRRTEDSTNSYMSNKKGNVRTHENPSDDESLQIQGHTHWRTNDGSSTTDDIPLVQAPSRGIGKRVDVTITS